MAISSRFLSELRDRLALSDVISPRVKLTRAGREYKGCCPFHNEKTPSFYVNDEKQFYHCFGCGAHGDVIGFVMAHDNLSFPDAVETLAAQAGMQVPVQKPEDIEKARREKSLFSLMEDTAWFFHEALGAPAHRDALAYLHERGIDNQTIAAYKIGFAPADEKALYEHLLKKEYTRDQMIAAGVIRKSKKDGAPYAFFRDRVMFPVCDRRGNVVAFGGRILPENLRPPARSDYTPPKYINSSDTELFHKGRVLYGESQARQAVLDGAPLIVVEGYLDVIACSKAGFKGAVAPLGTALTEDQIVIMWQMIKDQQKNPVLCFDGDNAGGMAAARAAERIMPLLKPNQSARFAFLPQGEDPDSLIRAHGKKAFASIVESAMPLDEFIWFNHTNGKRFETPEQRAGLARALEQECERIADRSVQIYYRQAFQERVRRAFGQRSYKPYNLKKPANRNLHNVKLGRPSYSKQRLAQLILLSTIINHPEIFTHVEEQLGMLEIDDQRLEKLRAEILLALGENSGLDIEELKRHLISLGFEAELGMLQSRSVMTHASFALPGCELDKVLKGWQEMIGLTHEGDVKRELQNAGRALAEDFSKDNEDRILALQSVNNSVDNG
jgi:DNA primase